MFIEKLTKPTGGGEQSNFVYLVHGLIDWNDGREMEERVKKILEPDNYYRASMVGRFDAEAAKKALGYRGEVHQVGAFGNIGLIVKPPSDDSIAIAWNCDLGSPWNPEELKKYVELHKGKRKAPFELLTDTKGDETIKYNELVIKGDERTEIEGVFYRSNDPEAEYQARVLSEIVEKVTQKKKVPVVKIPMPKIRDDRYDKIADQKTRELARACKSMQAMSEIMMAHLEFMESERFRRKFEYHFIPGNYPEPVFPEKPLLIENQKKELSKVLERLPRALSIPEDR